MNKKIYKISIVTTILVIILFSFFSVYAADEISVNAKAALIVERNTNNNTLPTKG